MNQEQHDLQSIGYVTEITNGNAKVSLTGGGCTSCHNSLCMLGESKAKQIIAKAADTLRVGDEVIVRINPSSGYKAVMLLYLLPFFLMLTSLVVANQMNYHEGVAGLAALLILIPYFGVLYLLRARFHSQCTINIERP